MSVGHNLESPWIFYILTIFLAGNNGLFPYDSYLYPFYGSLSEHVMHLHDSLTEMCSQVFSSLPDPELIRDQHCLSTGRLGRSQAASCQASEASVGESFPGSADNCYISQSWELQLSPSCIFPSPITMINASSPYSTSSHGWQLCRQGHKACRSLHSMRKKLLKLAQALQQWVAAVLWEAFNMTTLSQLATCVLFSSAESVRDFIMWRLDVLI